ncbi:hypothetical protein [Luteolibacter marinus]|uniref:hypothetical protein n=1 Tax=Luteolibacter marinus TaxID=2776705 RepID=UPI001868531D|nr:hypothetical protein [Luteolibacter marinus]
MRKLVPHFARFAVAIVCLALCSCFDVREEIWIARNGSGRAELTYHVPSSALRLAGGSAGLEDRIRALIASEPKLRTDQVEVTEIGEDASIVVRISTDSMLSLLDLKDNEEFQSLPKSAGGIAGEINFKLRGLDVDFTRSVDVGGALGLASLAVGVEDRKNRHLTYIIHLPKAPRETNATSVRDGGKTLVWEATLGEALRRPIVTHFRAAMPIPWFVHAAAAFVLVCLAVLVRRRLKRAKP